MIDPTRLGRGAGKGPDEIQSLHAATAVYRAARCYEVLSLLASFPFVLLALGLAPH